MFTRFVFFVNIFHAACKRFSFFLLQKKNRCVFKSYARIRHRKMIYEFSHRHLKLNRRTINKINIISQRLVTKKMVTEPANIFDLTTSL